MYDHLCDPESHPNVTLSFVGANLWEDVTYGFLDSCNPTFYFRELSIQFFRVVMDNMSCSKPFKTYDMHYHPLEILTTIF